MNIGVHIELLARKFLNRVLQGRHLLPEVRVQSVEVVAVDENAGVFHAREHGDQWKLERGCKLPGALRAELFFYDRRHDADRHGFAAHTLFFVGRESQSALLAGLRVALLCIEADA